MTEQSETPNDQPAVEPAAAEPASAQPGAVEPEPTPQPPPAQPAFAAPPPAAEAPYSPDAGGTARADERPELAVGAAFAGGFILAKILRRLAR